MTPSAVEPIASFASSELTALTMELVMTPRAVSPATTTITPEAAVKTLSWIAGGHSASIAAVSKPQRGESAPGGESPARSQPPAKGEILTLFPAVRKTPEETPTIGGL